MLETKVPPGRTRSIPTWAEKALAKRLQEPQGFEGYGAIQEWLKTKLGIIQTILSWSGKGIASDSSVVMRHA